MKIKLIKALGFCTFLMLSSVTSIVHAGIISQSAESDALNIQLSGLQWLDFSHTKGKNTATVNSEMNSYDGIGGWRYATAVEAETLMDSLCGVACNVEGWSTDYFAGVDWFQTNFTSHVLAGSWMELYFMYALGEDGSPSEGRAGYTALTTSEGWLNSSWGLSGGADIYTGLGGGSAVWAHMLVRGIPQVDPNPSDIPEPSTLAIFILGLMGLASKYFKTQSSL